MEKDFNDMTLEELKNLSTEVEDRIAEVKAENKLLAEAEKEERAEKFKNELNAGDKVTFLYGSQNEIKEGVIVRVSEKTVTVESDVFSSGKSYVRFDRFVRVTEKAEVFENEPKMSLDELVEAVV